jgi:hypothetical protein
MCTTTNFIQEAVGQRNGVHLEFGSPNHVDQFDTAVELDHPYQCDPTNNHNFCWLAYNSEENVNELLEFVGTECKCALDGDRGYCGEVIGTHAYTVALAEMRIMLKNSECHTLDRDNWRAQKDSCGVKNDEDMENWTAAVDNDFNIKNWPYVQSDRVAECFKQMSVNSL